MATNGNDSIVGGSGDDDIKALGGDDKIEGNDGDDQIDGRSGGDDIKGDDGEDTIDGGSDDDKIDGGNDDDTIYGDDGNDELESGNGENSVYGGEGNDTIKGGSGDNVLYGNDGDDSIKGGSGDDALIGGSGNDSIETGSGDDTVEGGTGDDTMKAGGGQDTFVVRDGHGSDLIEGFSDIEDIVAFDMGEISAYSDVLARMPEDDGDTLITFDNGDVLRLEGVENSDLSGSNFQYSAGPVCFLAGTPILTERGSIAVEDLRPDDVIWTKDRGWQALLLVVLETMVFKHRDDPAKPVLIPKGALDSNTPNTDLIVSPQHRILQIIPVTEEEVLVPAVKLIGLNGIRRMRGKKRAEYLNVVLEQHSVIQAAGCWVESLLVTQRSLSRQTEAARRLLDHALDMTPARRVERKGVRPRHLRSA